MKSLKQEEMKEFESEVLTISKLTHKNIVQFYGIYKENDIFYIVTEFLNRGSARDLVLKTKLTIQQLEKM